MSTIAKGAGADGQAERRYEETVRVLAGLSGAHDSHAVRYGDLRKAVLAIIADKEAAAAELDAGSGVSPSRGQVADFRSAEQEAGFWFWQMSNRFARPNTLNPPPTGIGGAALFMEREPGVGTWLASLADGGRGANEGRLYTLTTSAQAGDFSAWREIFTQESLLGAVGMSAAGEPTGAAMEFGSNANGAFLRFASGQQVCWKSGIRVDRTTDDRMEGTWTFPAEFAASTTPVLIPTLPSSAMSGAAFSGVGVLDVGHVAVDVGATSATILVRRCYGAPNFASGSYIEGIQAAAIGRWWAP